MFHLLGEETHGEILLGWVKSDMLRGCNSQSPWCLRRRWHARLRDQRKTLLWQSFGCLQDLGRWRHHCWLAKPFAFGRHTHADFCRDHKVSVWLNYRKLFATFLGIRWRSLCLADFLLFLRRIFIDFRCVEFELRNRFHALCCAFFELWCFIDQISRSWIPTCLVIWIWVHFNPHLWFYQNWNNFFFLFEQVFNWICLGRHLEIFACFFIF